VPVPERSFIFIVFLARMLTLRPVWIIWADLLLGNQFSKLSKRQHYIAAV
jgi:hypothetical protein